MKGKRENKKNSKLVTEEYLDKKLSGFATKKDLEATINLLQLDIKLDIKEAFEKHEEQHKKDKDEILTKMDGIAADLQAKREDDAAGTLRLDDHEKRISSLEAA